MFGNHLTRISANARGWPMLPSLADSELVGGANGDPISPSLADPELAGGANGCPMSPASTGQPMSPAQTGTDRASMSTIVLNAFRIDVFSPLALIESQ
jgi:hypothetical protein